MACGTVAVSLHAEKKGWSVHWTISFIITPAILLVSTGISIIQTVLLGNITLLKVLSILIILAMLG